MALPFISFEVFSSSNGLHPQWPKPSSKFSAVHLDTTNNKLKLLWDFYGAAGVFWKNSCLCRCDTRTVLLNLWYLTFSITKNRHTNSFAMHCIAVCSHELCDVSRLVLYVSIAFPLDSEHKIKIMFILNIKLWIINEPNYPINFFFRLVVGDVAFYCRVLCCRHRCDTQKG